MAVAKNKLQDIYNSALTRLAELEASQRQALTQMYQKYNDTDEIARDDLGKNVSGKQELLASEIQFFVSNSMARIQSAVDMQCSLTNNCLNRCTQQLALAARKFDEQLNYAKSRQDVLEKDSLDELSAQFSAFVEQSLMGFLQVQNQWSQKLRNKHADFRSSLEQAIVTGVAGLRQCEHDLTDTVQSVAMENMSRLRTEAENIDEQLRAKYQEQNDRLQAKLGELDATFQKHHKTVMLEAEAQAGESSRELTARFDKMYAAPASELADAIAKHKSELQKSFESSTSVLGGVLEKTRTEIAKVADERAAAIDTRAKEVHSRINSDVEKLMQKLTSSFGTSSKLEQELQKDNDEVSDQIRADLSKLFDSFKKSMDGALNETVNDLSKACKSAGQELSASCRESQSSMNSISLNIQREIDGSVSQIVERIRQARKAAIEKVERAVRSNAAGAAAPATVRQDLPEAGLPEAHPPRVHKEVAAEKATAADAEIWADAEVYVEDREGNSTGSTAADPVPENQEDRRQSPAGDTDE